MVSSKQEVMEQLSIVNHLVTELLNNIDAPLTNDTWKLMDDMSTDVVSHMIHLRGLMFKN